MFLSDFVYSLNLMGGNEFVLFGSAPKSLVTFSALFGQQTTYRSVFNVQYQAGVGMTNVNKNPFWDERLFGVAAQLGLNLMLSDQALLGLDLQGNINLEDYLLAVMINFEIGL